MYRYLVYIRPVAYAILRKCFHHDFANSLLFAPLSRRGSWSTKTFTEELKRLSMDVPGIPCRIGTQLYRQLSNVIHKRAPHTSERRTFQHCSAIILNYTAITLIINNNYIGNR
jgi:hypothetical protein